MKVAEALQESEQTSNILPLPVPQLDETDGLVTIIGAYLRKLPVWDRIETSQEIIMLLTEKLKKQKDNL